MFVAIENILSHKDRKEGRYGLEPTTKRFNVRNRNLANRNTVKSIIYNLECFIVQRVTLQVNDQKETYNNIIRGISLFLYCYTSIPSALPSSWRSEESRIFDPDTYTATVLYIDVT